MPALEAQGISLGTGEGATKTAMDLAVVMVREAWVQYRPGVSR